MVYVYTQTHEICKLLDWRNICNKQNKEIKNIIGDGVYIVLSQQIT